jgi:hypothetical protein
MLFLFSLLNSKFPHTIIKTLAWSIDMKRLERILIKLIIVQFVFLILAQIFFHNLNVFPELKEITQYEGVNNNQFTEILETLSR